MTTYSSSFETSPKRSFSEEYESQFMRRTPEAPVVPPQPPPTEQPPASAPIRESAIFSKAAEIFRGLELDDLLVIAIGVLLLLDSDENMDTVLIFVAAMLFF